MDKRKPDRKNPTSQHGEDQAEALDQLFAVAARQAPQPSGDLMQRVLEDALAAQQDLAAVPAPPRRPRVGWRDLVAAIGGWPAMAGLVSAGLAGVWIGVNPPEVMADGATALFALETDSYLVDVGLGQALELTEG